MAAAPPPPSKSFSWVDELKKCDTEPLNPFALLAEHCVKWDSRKMPHMHNGVYASESTMTWWMCSFAYSEFDGGQRGPISGDTMVDFPLLKLMKNFMPLNSNVKITNLPMSDTVNLLMGLEWHVFSSPSRTDYSEDWWAQVMRLYKVLTRRIFFLTQGTFTINVLDSPEYAETYEYDMRKFGMNSAEEDPNAALKEAEEEMDGGDPNRYQSEDEIEEEAVEEVDAHSSDEEDGGGGGGRKKRRKMTKRVRRILRMSKIVQAPPALPGSSAGMTKEKTKAEIAAEEEIAKKKKAEEDAQYNAVNAYTTAKWFYDMDSVMTQFWLHAFEFETSPVPTPVPHMDLAPFRKWLFGIVRSLKEDDVTTYRRIWYDDLMVTEAMKRIHIHKNPMDIRPASRAIIINKHDDIYAVHCKSKDAVCDEQAHGELLRMNTDAMFHMYARTLGTTESGDIVKAVYKKTFRDVDGPLCIYRDPIRNQWILHFASTPVIERYMAPSFTAAFMYMRQRMRELDMNAVKDEYNLAVWDDHFFPRGEEGDN